MSVIKSLMKHFFCFANQNKLECSSLQDESVKYVWVGQVQHYKPFFIW
jgi:hypothetical protein